MTTTGDGTASPMKRKAKSRYLNVKLPPKVFGMVEEMTTTGDDMTKRAKTAIVIRGIKLVAKELGLQKKRERHLNRED